MRLWPSFWRSAGGTGRWTRSPATSPPSSGPTCPPCGPPSEGGQGESLVTLRLIEVGEGGRPVEEVPLSVLARSVCEAAAAVYRATGFVRPWVGYLAEEGGRVVG